MVENLNNTEIKGPQSRRSYLLHVISTIDDIYFFATRDRQHKYGLCPSSLSKILGSTNCFPNKFSYFFSFKLFELDHAW